MSELLHPGHHPDADVLSAFAEHALSDHERLETLAHLSACADCREIVFLAQQAHEAHVPQPHGVGGRTGWLRSWRTLWPVAAVLTCGLLVFAFLQHRRPVDVPQRATIAFESSEAVPPSHAELIQPAVPESIPSPRSSATAKMATSPHRAAAAPHGNAAGISTVNGNLATNHLNNNLSVFGRDTTTVDQQSASAFTAGSHSMGSAVGGPVAQAAPAQERKSNLLAARGEPMAAVPSQNQLFPQEPAAARSSNEFHGDLQQSASQSVSVTSAPPLVQSHGAVLSASTFSGKAALARNSSARAPLPSTLPAASTISNGFATLAVDSVGELFLSKDAGMHWQRVAQQWTGKAVKVSLESPVSKTQGLAGTPSAGFDAVTPAAVPTRVGLELTTDAGAVWSSVDGLVWRQR
jgi:hypothetical protein